MRERLYKNLSSVIIGKSDVIDLIITAIISKGHILIEDVPSTGRTMLAKSLALSIDSKFGRIQFTPDMLLSNVTGISFYNQVNHKPSSEKALYLRVLFLLTKLTMLHQKHNLRY